MDIQLFNTLSRSKEIFKPIKPNHVGLYCCGPTVYYFAHVGNLRTYIFEDLLVRMFLYNNYKVKHVMNITDVGHLTSDADEGEDKIIKAAREQGKSAYEIAEFFTEAFFKDAEKLNILRPSIICKATDHIKEMIDMIKKLEKNGYTYQAEGNIYFNTEKFKDYGKLAKLNLEKLSAGARIKVDPNKKNPHDFVLWFTKSKFKDQEMQWDSPWDRGYPGWHIECSAMASKYLGEKIDIHCGGIDHIPVHHTNEIAQAEGAFEHKWTNYWLHGEFLITDKKMSKSLKNIKTIADLEKNKIDPLSYRYFCLNAHYRSPLTFSMDAVKAAQTAYQNLKNKIIDLKNNLKKDQSSKGDMTKYQEEFHNAINDDLNVPVALAALHKALKDNSLGAKEKLELAENFDHVLGLKLSEAEETKAPEEIVKLAEKRDQARKNKDWKKSDELRAQIESKGFIIEDSKEGYKIKKK